MEYRAGANPLSRIPMAVFPVHKKRDELELEHRSGGKYGKRFQRCAEFLGLTISNVDRRSRIATLTVLRLHRDSSCETAYPSV